MDFTQPDNVESFNYSPSHAGPSIAEHRPISSMSERPDNVPISERPSDAATDIEVLRSIPSRFAVIDEETANWLVRRIVAARKYGEHVKAWAELEGRRAVREEHTLMWMFGRQIEDWLRSEIEKLNGRRKSVPLPAGTIGFRKYNACLQIDDERAVLNWAKENCPSAVMVVEKLSRAILKEYFEKTGNIPDGGAHVEPAAEKFFIR